MHLLWRRIDEPPADDGFPPLRTEASQGRTERWDVARKQLVDQQGHAQSLYGNAKVVAAIGGSLSPDTFSARGAEKFPFPLPHTAANTLTVAPLAACPRCAPTRHPPSFFSNVPATYRQCRTTHFFFGTSGRRDDVGVISMEIRVRVIGIHPC